MGDTLQGSVSDRSWAPFRPGVLDDEARLIGSRCPTCGASFFPLRKTCSRCLTEDLPSFVLSGEGSVYTFTIVRQAAPGFDVPYVLAYVDFPQGVRMLGQVVGVDPEGVHIGMTLRLEVEPVGEDEDGRSLLGFRFHAEEAPHG